MRTDRRDFITKMGGAAAAGALSHRAFAAQATARRPNIILVLADDLGYAHLGCYGQKIIQTPNLDRLASEGMRFTQSYAGCTVCAPSRSVLMTGLHTGHTAVRANSGGVPLSDEDITVAEVLKKSGYATGLFGKWGLGDAETSGVPTRQGFDEFFGYLHQVHAHFYYPEYLWHNEQKHPLPGNAGGKRGQYSHDLVAERATAFIRANKDRPFFCYLAFTIPHVELIAPEETLALYKGKFAEKPLPDSRPGYNNPAEPKATLAAMITHMDKSVGRVMALLKELAIDENTIVFFASDNGGPGGAGNNPEFFETNGPLRGFKTTMYEGGLRVPMIARWPGRIQSGSVDGDHVWYFADFMPTLAELADAQPPANIDGLSVVPALLGEKAAGRKQEPHQYLYWEFGPEGRLQQALRMGQWKAVRPKGKTPLELYDLGKDIGEKNNVAAQNPDIVGKIEERMKAARTPQRPQIEPEKQKGQRYR